MAANKKPRKRYRPKPVVRPLNVRNQWDIEGEAHAALLAMEYGHVEQEHLAMLCAHADMVRRLFDPSDPVRRQADTIIRIVSEITDRPELRVWSGEEAAIRAAMQVTLPAIRAASNSEIYHASMAALRELSIYGGVRVNL